MCTYRLLSSFHDEFCSLNFSLSFTLLGSSFVPCAVYSFSHQNFNPQKVRNVKSVRLVCLGACRPRGWSVKNRRRKRVPNCPKFGRPFLAVLQQKCAEVLSLPRLLEECNVTNPSSRCEPAIDHHTEGGPEAKGTAHVPTNRHAYESLSHHRMLGVCYITQMSEISHF